MSYHHPAGKPYPRPNRVLKIIVVVLMIIILSLILALVSAMGRLAALAQVNPDVILFENPPYEEYGDAFGFMKEAYSYELLCAGVGGNRGSMRYDPDAITQWTEIYIDGKRVVSDQLYAESNYNLPTTTSFCLPHGLNKGQYLMTMRLKDSPVNEIRVYRWLVTIRDREPLPPHVLKGKIAALRAHPEQKPMTMSVTERAQPYTPVCATIDTLLEDTDNFYDGYIRYVQGWSELFINEAKIAPSNLTFSIDEDNRGLMIFCYAKGLPVGSYLMTLSTDWYRPDPARIYHWVLTVKS